jgi:vancomycin permeability regulator SanA
MLYKRARIKGTRKTKITLYLFGTALLIVGLLLLINIYMVESAKGRIITEEKAAQESFDCILVLGAGVWGERPSPMLEDRLLQGIKLYNIGVSDRLLVSGDHGSKEYDEVNIMKKFAVDKGVPSEHVFMDHAGFDTYSSLYRTRDIFKAEKIVIVTQKYHLYRSLYISKSLGLDAYGVASDPRLYAGQIKRDFREILARAKAFATVIIKPEPKYLGESIPVAGNGDITNDDTLVK